MRLRISRGGRRTAALLSVALILGGCRQNKEDASAAAPPTVTLGPENIALAEDVELMSGPTLSGELAADRKATVRAEVAGTMLRTDVEQGQKVRAGQVLGRLDDTALRDTYQSARSGVQTARASLELARRNLERADTLAKAGAISEREVETAAWNVTNGETQLADAQARLATAEKQFNRTMLRAPISGIVSERKVSAGDVVQVGNELFTIIDPSSMRLEATVPAEQLSELRPGAPVRFTVTGYGSREFQGKVERVNPAVDPATRQVRIYVTIPNASSTLVAGLFAQGRVGTAHRHGIVVPEEAVDRRGLRPTVVRLKDARVERVEVEVGLRDEASDRVEITSGLAAGDTVLMASSQGLAPGTIVRVREDEGQASSNR